MNLSNSPPTNSELVSALVDGQLASNEVSLALGSLKQDPALLDCWRDYHLIGEVLRSPSVTVSTNEALFFKRLQDRLGAESVATATPFEESATAYLTERQEGALRPDASVVSVRQGYTAPPANDPAFRWKLFAGAASFTAVVAIAWSVAGVTLPTAGSQLAQAGFPQQVLVASPQGTMVRDVRLEELLAAHKQFGGTSALQMPSGFLRNATFENSVEAGK